MSAVKVICSGRPGRDHREVLVGRIDYRAEDATVGPVPEDFAPGDPRREDEPITVHAGATVGGRGATREDRPQGGTKSRIRCSVCGLDLAVSWDTLNRDEVARRLVEAGVRRVNLSALASRITS